MTSKGYSIIPENESGFSTGKGYSIISEDRAGKGYNAQSEAKEGFLKSLARTGLQPIQGALESTVGGIAAGLLQFAALGESDLDIEEWHKLRELAEQEGGEFNEEGYEQARQQMLGQIPTVHNIGEAIEERTGIPLTPKENYQKALRLGSLAGAFTKGTAVQKLASGATAAGTSQGLQALGVPELFADIPALALGSYAGGKTPALEMGKSQKPSGFTERRFESLKEPHEVSQGKLSQINQKVESDFRDISDRIIKESPVGETFENLKNDPTFKQQSRELLDQAQEVANKNPEPLPTELIKREMADMVNKRVKGFALDEADKSYIKLMKENSENILGKKTTRGELIEQYRKKQSGIGRVFRTWAIKSIQ